MKLHVDYLLLATLALLPCSANFLQNVHVSGHAALNMNQKYNLI